MTASQSASAIFQLMPSRVMPAQQTSASSRPNAPFTSETIFSASAKSATSASKKRARRPFASHARTTDSAASRSPRSTTAMSQPSAASDDAMAAPMPRPAPVMSATFPERPRSMRPPRLAPVPLQSVQHEADDLAGELLDRRVLLRVEPHEEPVEHPEDEQRRVPHLGLRRHLAAAGQEPRHGVGDELVVAPPELLDAPVRGARERLQLEGAQLQLVDVLGEEREVVPHEDLELLLGRLAAAGAGDLLGEERGEDALLDAEEQLLLALEVVVQAGEAVLRGARDVAHRGVVVAALGHERAGPDEEVARALGRRRQLVPLASRLPRRRSRAHRSPLAPLPPARSRRPRRIFSGVMGSSQTRTPVAS